MREIRCAPLAIATLTASLTLAGTVEAQDQGIYPVGYIPPSQSSIFNQNSVSLPAAPTPYGQDIVRSASGVTCQSSVASSGPYLDVGVISSDDVFNRQTNAVYGRVVMPLGKRPERIDCSSLYELEIARLKMELQVMRLGMPTEVMSPAGTVSGAYGGPHAAEPVSPTRSPTAGSTETSSGIENVRHIQSSSRPPTPRIAPSATRRPPPLRTAATGTGPTVTQKPCANEVEEIEAR
ncbi:MAG: hypothetical protein GC152_02780 [Alphaproteobacteria bacterium]|nr:hypothetical protein [Alphaproteobacteria bacterium]